MALYLRGKPIMERIAARVEIDPQTGCHNWTACKNQLGYGFVTEDGGKSMIYVHRAVYRHYHGPLPEDKEIDHVCKNRGCCNIEHLALVTHAENHQRRFQHFTDRKVCLHGHALTPENRYYVPPSLTPRCKICRSKTAKKSLEKYHATHYNSDFRGQKLSESQKEHHMSLAGDIKDLQSQYESAHSQGYKTTTIRTAELGTLLEHRAALLEACKETLKYCNCSLKQRMSGHLTDCFAPRLEEAIATAERREPPAPRSKNGT